MHILRPLLIVCREWLGNDKFGAVPSGDLDGTCSRSLGLPEERDGGQGWGHWGDYRDFS